MRHTEGQSENHASHAIRVLLWGQLSFAAGLLLCFVLRPQFLQSEGGFSNYGVTPITIPPFTLAFLAAAISAWWAASPIAHAQRTLANLLRILSVLFAAVLLSTYPYKINNFFDVLHQDTALALFAFELGFGLWLAARGRRFIYWSLLGAQIAGTIAGVYTVWGGAHLLFISQLVVGLAFGMLLVVASRQVFAKGKEV